MSGKPLPDGYLPGGVILKAPPVPPAIWGAGNEVLWAVGQGLLVYGPDGTGKTQLTGNLARGLLGLRSEVLGMRIRPLKGGKRILLLLMDRPLQALSNFSRMFSEDEQELLDERVAIWKGPPRKDLAKNDGELLKMCEDADASVVIVDSLKDAAIGLSNEETGQGWNWAVQRVIASGRQVLVLHRPRKAQEGNKTPNTIDDIYGNAFLFNGMGSIICLWGQPGDAIVQLIHIKQPAAELGPWQVEVCENGDMRIAHSTDLIELARLTGEAGITARDAAGAMFEVVSPTRNQIEKARRKLAAKTNEGLLICRPGTRGRGASSVPACWVAADRVITEVITGGHEIPADQRFRRPGNHGGVSTEVITGNHANGVSAGQEITGYSREVITDAPPSIEGGGHPVSSRIMPGLQKMAKP